MKTEEHISTEALIGQHPALLLYFYNDNCSTCFALRPKIEALASRYPQIKLQFINASEFPEEAAKRQVYAAPLILVYFDGKEYIRESRFVSISELTGKIDRYYSLMFD